MKKGNTFHSSGQTSNSLDLEIDELKVSKRHAVASQIDYFIKVIGGGGEGWDVMKSDRGGWVLFLVSSFFLPKMGILNLLFRFEPVSRKKIMVIFFLPQ